MVEKVGVVGLGTMGSGIAQLCVQAGVPTVACESSSELAARGRGLVERQLARGVEKGRLTEEDMERMLGLLEPVDGRRGARRLRPRDRGSVRGPRRQAGPVRAHRGRDRPGPRSRDEHLGSLGDRDRLLPRAAAAPRRHAFLQPGAGAAARRGDPRPAHVGCRVRHGLLLRGADRQGPDRLRRHARVRRQPDPDPGPQRRGARARGGNGEPGGHRQGHAPRHRLADRAARADRPDRDRRPRPCLRGALERVPRAQVRAAAPTRADGARQGCSDARAARASTATTADSRLGAPGGSRWCAASDSTATSPDPHPCAADVVAPHRRQQVLASATASCRCRS